TRRLVKDSRGAGRSYKIAPGSPLKKISKIKWISEGGALGGTRTPTILLTATSRQRVYQFRHERFATASEQGPSGPDRPPSRRRCNKWMMPGQEPALPRPTIPHLCN